MSVIGSNILAGASGQGGYFIDRSVRLRSSASAYFNRTPASAGNRQKFTVSVWYKAGGISSGPVNANILNAGGDGSSLLIAGTGAFGATYQDRLMFREAGTTLFYWPMVFRDPSAWYHIVFAIDTTQATAANRAKLYVNGVDQGAFSGAAITQNTNTSINNTSAHYINTFNGTFYPSDLYYTEYNFIDGQALTPSDFGEYDADTGVWKPKKYVGTYGTNGFYLNFSDNTSTTTLGYDYSGNGNNWTANNISLTSGVTYDSMLDVPTLTSETAGNYAVLNPLDKYTNVTLSNANLSATFSAYTGFVRSTFALPSTGKWYWEGTVPTSDPRAEFGIATFSQALGVDPQGASGCWFWYSNGTASYKYNAGTGTAWGSAWASGDTIGIAFDADAGTLTYYLNGSLQGGGSAATGLTGTYSPMVGFGNNTSTAISVNFGQRPFAYTPPTGFKALNTFNLPDSTIVDGSTAFNAVLYTGATPTLDINTVGFQPDLVWIKSRSSAYHGALVDSVRGVDKFLYSSLTIAEETQTSQINFDSTGFNVTGTLGNINNSGSTYVAWNWKAGGTAVSNTDGSITSSVSANTTSGFSVVTWTGTGSNATVGHGLGVAPAMIIPKNRGSDTNWWVHHKSLTNNPGAYLVLNSTSAQANAVSVYNQTNPTSSVFTVGTENGINQSGSSMVAYCFAEVPGFSKFGSYTGNGSADGTFVYTGFRPRWIMIGPSSNITNWAIIDTSRDTYNLAGQSVEANLSNAEYTPASSGYPIDILSNGFKQRSSSQPNTSGQTYIYAAFAENPFKNSLAR